LHPNERAWLEDDGNIEEFIQWMCETNNDCSLNGDIDKARSILSRQALRQIDFSWNYFLGDAKEIDLWAGEFLLNESGLTVDGDQGFIARSGGDYYNYKLFLDDAYNNLDFYKENIFAGILPDRTVKGLELKLLAEQLGLLTGSGDLSAIYNDPMFYGDASEAAALALMNNMLKGYGEAFNVCDGDADCAFDRMITTPLSDLYSGQLDKFLNSNADNINMLGAVYNNQNMGAGQHFENAINAAIATLAVIGTKQAITGIKDKITGNSQMLPGYIEGLPVPKDLPTQIHSGAQGKHIIGHSNFMSGRSTLDPGINPQQLLDGIHSGQHNIIGYNARNMPIVNFGKQIGVDAVSGLPTQYGVVHYGKNGAHIVPHNPTLINKP
jgi:hypothetical protein